MGGIATLSRMWHKGFGAIAGHHYSFAQIYFYPPLFYFSSIWALSVSKCCWLGGKDLSHPAMHLLISKGLLASITHEREHYLEFRRVKKNRVHPSLPFAGSPTGRIKCVTDNSTAALDGCILGTCYSCFKLGLFSQGWIEEGESFHSWSHSAC